ncbi:MAG: DMT family transporter [Mycobacterium sp.]|jgi:bacterial/archaeal transporter family-2 protein|uniref:DMT family transporter n=1 Tax=Mycobacterium sp. TaxID=1785 RepID=UPI003C4FA689
MNASWMIPFIVLGGALQTCGAAMNSQLYKHMINPWLASAISAAVVAIFFIAVFVVRSKPLPSAQDAWSMPWWAVIGGLVGAVQVYAGLTLVHRVGAGVFIGLTVTAALIMSLLVDHFGWLRVDPHPISLGRVIGGLLLISGVALISKF